MKSLSSFLFKTTLYIFATLIILTLGLLVSVLVIWKNPQYIVTEKNIRWSTQYLPENIQVDWKTLHLNFAPLDFWSKDIQIFAEELCFNYKPMVEGCLEKIHFEFKFSIKDFKPKLLEISEINTQARHIYYYQQETQAPPPARETIFPDLRLPPFAGLVPELVDFKLIREIDIALANFQFHPLKGDVLQAQGSLKRMDIVDDQELDLILKVTAKQNQKFSLTSLNDLQISKNQFTIKGRTQFTHPMISAHVFVDGHWNQDLYMTLSPTLKKGKIVVSPLVKLDWNQTQIRLDISKFSTAQLWPQGTIQSPQCLTLADLDKNLGHPKHLEFDCTLTATPKHPIFKDYEAIKTRIMLALSLERSKIAFKEQLLLDGKLRLNATHSLVQGYFETEGAFTFLSSEGIKLTDVNARLTSDLNIPEIQSWRKIFERTNISIPAPLNVLRGNADLVLSAEIQDVNSPLTAEVQLQTHFRSQTQIIKTSTDLDITTKGDLFRPTGIHLKILSQLQEVQLEAPPLALEMPPQISPDKRFVHTKNAENIRSLNQNQPAKKALPLDITWEAHVETVKPLRVVVNLLKNPLPITLKLTHNSHTGLDGIVQLEKMPVEIFKKNADVQYVKVLFHKGSKIPGLDGLITYRNPEVDIKIMVLGNTQNPRIEFESQPELNRQQIISVILFNKSLDELNEEEVSSATNISRAMSDGALGLFSLMFLSSTPIQSVGYDPVSKSYTARLKIDDNTTFAVGSDFESQRNFSVRRRLGGPWSLRTELRQTSDTSDVVVTLLEWLKRF